MVNTCPEGEKETLWFSIPVWSIPPELNQAESVIEWNKNVIFVSCPEMPKKHVFERLEIGVNDCKICASPDVLLHNNSSGYQVHTLSWTCGKVSKNTFLATAAWALMVRLLTWPSLSWIINLSKMAFNESKTGRQLDSRQPLRDGVSLSVSSLPKNHLTNRRRLPWKPADSSSTSVGLLCVMRGIQIMCISRKD